jgi:hypothetical protein
MRKKDDAELRARRITDAAALALRVFEVYRHEAARLHMQAEERGIDVKFMGTPRGVLAVEKTPGALRLAVARCDWPGGRTLRDMIETEGYSKSPEVLAAIPKQETPVGPFFVRIAEKECRDLLCGPERKVSLFSGYMDEEGHLMMPPLPMNGVKLPTNVVRLLPPLYPSYVWDEEFDWEDADSGFAGGAADLLAGGGFHVK